MEKSKKNELLNILKNQLVPAQGCTEPIAVAYSTATAREKVTGDLEEIKIKVSPNIYKNGLRVGIPGTGERGLLIAGALGYLAGNPTKGLQVIEDITEKDIAEAKEVVENGKIAVDVAEDVDRFYIETRLISDKEKIRCITLDQHLNIVDTIRIERGIDLPPFKINSSNDDPGLKTLQEYNLNEIMEWIEEIEIDQLKFLEEGINLSQAIAKEGLEQQEFMATNLSSVSENNENLNATNENDIINETQRLCAAASEARMRGSKKAVMSNSGSGNQGITAFLTVIGAANVKNSSHEQLLRALALSNLMTIYVKSYLGVLSAMCGAGIAAGTGASAGVVYLLGGKTEDIYRAAINMLGVVTGMICDGAKEGCAYKVALSAGWAVRSALFAVNGTMIDSGDGILAENFNQLLENLSHINNPGMTSTDKAILDVMLNSQKQR